MEKKLLLKHYLLRPDDVFYMSDTAFASENSLFLTTEKPPHTHDFYEFFFVMEGEVSELLNGVQQSVAEKELRILLPNDRHHIFTSPDRKKSKIRNVAIRADYFENRLNQLSRSASSFNKRLSLGYFAYHELIERTNEAQKYVHDSVKYHFIMASVLDTVMIKACISNQNEIKSPLWLKKLCADMQAVENYVQGLPRMLELACRSQGYLNRCMKKFLGVTSTEYINTLRLHHAAELLRSTDKKIVDIAYECGFESVPYFNKIFKEQFVVPPHVYRHQSIC